MTGRLDTCPGFEGLFDETRQSLSRNPLESSQAAPPVARQRRGHQGNVSNSRFLSSTPSPASFPDRSGRAAPVVVLQGASLLHGVGRAVLQVLP